VSEHFYPKYDYADYDDMEEEDRTASDNSGLSHPVHPSLQAVNETDRYENGFNSTPWNQSFDSSLSSFVPKTLSSYGTNLLADSYTEPEPEPAGGAIEESEAQQQVDGQADDYYGDVGSGTPALLW